jgi:hypothetical protein
MNAALREVGQRLVRMRALATLGEMACPVVQQLLTETGQPVRLVTDI